MSLRGPIALSLLTMVSGCAPLGPTTKSKSTNPLPAARLAPDAVVVDVAFVSLGSNDAEIYSTVWKAADEQPLPPELRRRLERNGLRVGVFGQQLPAQLNALLDVKPNLLESIRQGDAGELQLDGNRQHIPLRAGHRAVIKASNVFPILPVLLSEDGTVHGQQLIDARCIVSLKSHPLGDGRVKLLLTPEIEHGEAKTRWLGSEGMMIQHTGQDRLILDQLAWEALLRPGESLLVGPTADTKGLGEYFFQGLGKAAQRRLLVIRYSQSQFDDLFAREQTSAPLVTPGE